MSQKTCTATDIMLEFIANKLLDFIALIFVFAYIYLLLVIFYSNMVLFANIASRAEGLSQFTYALLWLICAAIFWLFALFIALSIVTYLISLFIPKQQPVPGSQTLKSTTEKIKKLKIYPYLQNFGNNIKSIFQWSPDSKARLKKRVLILFSIIAFYHSWFKVPAQSGKALQYHFMPDFMMETSNGLFRATRPLANTIYDYIVKYTGLAYNFIDQNVFDRISNLF